MTDLRGPTLDTRAGDVVSIVVSPDGPYGVSFVPDVDGCAAVIDTFDRLPSGKFGPMQRHGGVHSGDVLFEINDTCLFNCKFPEVMKLVTDRNILKKEFKFLNSREYYRRKRVGSVRAAPADRNNFFSSFRRTRVGEENSKKFTEYEIACQFRMASNKVQKENVYQWSVWKRYSDLEKLHQQLKRALGWQLDGVEFPPARSFTMNKLSPDFVEQRKSDLNEYWQKVTALEKVTDFNKHHCCLDLKEFLDVENNTKKEVAPAPDMITEVAPTEGENINAAEKRTSVRRGPVKTASRRVSLSKATSANWNESQSSAQSPTSPEQVPTTQTTASIDASKASPPPATPPPPPPSRPVAPPAESSPIAATSPVVAPPQAPPAAVPTSSANLPPRPSGARANLLSSINSLRKE